MWKFHIIIETLKMLIYFFFVEEKGNENLMREIFHSLLRVYEKERKKGEWKVLHHTIEKSKKDQKNGGNCI